MKLNDIFYDGDQYSKYAKFANKKGYIIQEIEQENGVRRFKICEPEPVPVPVSETPKDPEGSIRISGHVVTIG